MAMMMMMMAGEKDLKEGAEGRSCKRVDHQRKEDGKAARRDWACVRTECRVEVGQNERRGDGQMQCNAVRRGVSPPRRPHLRI